MGCFPEFFQGSGYGGCIEHHHPLRWVSVSRFLVQMTLPGLVLCFEGNSHRTVETPHYSFQAR
jgi:hypothetical protein